MFKRIFKSAIKRSSGNRKEETSINNDKFASKSNLPIDEESENTSVEPQTIAHMSGLEVTTEAPIKGEGESANTVKPVEGKHNHKADKEPHEKKPNTHELERKLSEFCIEAEKLVISTNWEPVYKSFNDMKEKWENIDPENSFNTLKERFNDTYIKFKKKYESHAKVKQNIKERENICNEIEAMLSTANAEDTLNKFNELQKQWNTAEEIPPRYYEILEKRFINITAEFHKEAERLKLEEEAKAKEEQLVEEIHEEIQTTENQEVLENEEEVSLPTDTNDENNETLKASLEDLLSLLKEHTSSDDIKSALNNVKEVQEKWENIQNGSLKNEYSKEFKSLFKDYFSKLKFIQQKDNWQRWENYTSKLLLCEQSENLLNEKDYHKVSREIKSIWDKWRKIGRAPKEKNDIIWERFNKTRRELNKRCKDFFNNLEKERQGNLEAKIKLCEEAEKLRDSEDWENTATALKDIQIRWKEAGRAPQPQDDELYQRLRAVCNYFFEKRTTHYNHLHERQTAHKERKKELCLQAEELVNLPWKEAFKKIKEIKSQWHAIPPASRKDEQVLWTRFNKSIDIFIEKIEKERPENLNRKQSLLESASSLLESITSEDNLAELDKKIEDLCKNWKTTGPAPKEQDYELNNLFDIKISELKQRFSEFHKQEKTKQIKVLLEKEMLIDKLEKSISAAIINNDMSSSLNTFKQIESEWKSLSIEASEKKAGEILEKRFEEACNAFHNGDEDYFNGCKEARKHNLNTKRKLCIQLEHLAEIDVPDEMINTHKSHTIADEIKFSIENNFAIKKNRTSDDITTKYKKIQTNWNNTGPVPIDYYEKIHMRYERACRVLEQKLRE